MAHRVTNPFLQYLDGNGDAYAGAKLEFYEAGTSTPLDTYSDYALTTPNANPVIADANGYFGDIFLAEDDNYKVILKDSSDNTVATADNVDSFGTAAFVTIGTSGATVGLLNANKTDSGDNTYSGNNTHSGNDTITGSMEHLSTDAGANAGPELPLYRNSASPATNDLLGSLVFYGRNNAPAKYNYGDLTVEILDSAAASEDSRLRFRIPVAGSLTNVMHLGAGLWVGSGAADPGAGKINAENGYEVGGVDLEVVTGQSLVRHAASSGTDGGGSTGATWTTRTLTSEIYDQGGFVTLSSNQITLGQGTYYVSAWQVFYSDTNNNQGCKGRFRNVTDGSTTALGTTVYASMNASTPLTTVQSIIAPTRFTIAGTKTFELQYYVESANSTDGLGKAATTGEDEIYAYVHLSRVSTSP